jgi:uncharacterized repeat protein (TIGR01451 family)
VNAFGRSFAPAFFVAQAEAPTMNTLAPFRDRRTTQSKSRTVARDARRRWRARELGPFESLERRDVPAVITPFANVFSATVTGNITYAANTLMTSPDSGGQAAIDARNGIGTDQDLNDDTWNMQYVDIDGDATTFNSSSAQLIVPAGANVLFARLYWGGRVSNDVAIADLEKVKFKVGGGSYSDLTGSLVGSIVGGVSNRGDDPRTYQCFVDVQDKVTAGGTFTVANVRGQEGAKNTCNGWSLVVAYSAPGSPGEVPRNLTVFQGFANVSNNSAADRSVTIDYSGFQAPSTGPVNATLGFVTYEGDRGIAGDRAFFKSQSSITETPLSDLPAIPVDNFFNSSISNRGSHVTTKSPNYLNQFGFDADLIGADGVIVNGDTGASIRMTSTQDQYYPGVITSAIDVYSPHIEVVKTVQNLNGGGVDPGDVLRYTVTVSNASGLVDGAEDVILDDLIPANTSYVANTLEVTGGANVGPKTDAPGDDQAEFTGTGVRFRLGTGANATVGGALAPGASTTITFDVQVSPAIVGGTTIDNTATVAYVSQTFGVPDSVSGSVSIECPAVDLAITKDDNVTTVTAGAGTVQTYTITVQNKSNAAAKNVVVTDVWPNGFVSGTFTKSQGTLSPSPPTGDFTWTIGTLGAGLTATLTATYTVPANTPAGPYDNTVEVTSTTYDPNRDNNTATDTTTVVVSAPLAITKTAAQFDVTAGVGEYTFTIAVKNTGFSAARDVIVNDPLPQGFVATAFDQPADVTPLPPVAGPAPFTWTIGTMAPGETRVLNVTYRVGTEVLAGINTNTAFVTSSTDIPRSASCDVNVIIIGQPTIIKTGPATFTPGEAISYTVTVINERGPSTDTNVQVVDVIPAGISSWSWIVTYENGGESFDGSPNFGVTSIDKRVNLPVLGKAIFTITNAQTSPAATADIVNIASATTPNGITVEAQVTSSPEIIPTEGVPALVVGSDDGCNGPPVVTVLDEQARFLTSFLAYDVTFRGGVRVFSADVTGDGVAEIITAPSRNYPGEVRVFSRIPISSLNYTLLPEYTFYPFGKSYRGGVEVAAGDFNGDGINDILCGQSTGAGMVSAFVVTPPPTIPGPIGSKAVSSTPYFSFRGFPSPYAGGVMVGAGDFGTFVVDGAGKMPARAIPKFTMTAAPDGRSEVVVGSNAGMRATVKVYAVTGAPNVKPTLTLVKTLNPFASTFRGGVTLSASPATQTLPTNLSSDLYIGAGTGGKSLVEVYKGGTWTKSTITAFSSFAKPNARVFAAPVDLLRDGVVDDVFGVQGLTGAGGTNGVMPESTGIPTTTSLKPAMRIAPIVDSLLLRRRR